MTIPTETPPETYEDAAARLIAAGFAVVGDHTWSYGRTLVVALPEGRMDGPFRIWRSVVRLRRDAGRWVVIISFRGLMFECPLEEWDTIVEWMRSYLADEPWPAAPL